MLEKIKEIPFIDESRAVKLTTTESGNIVLERSDKVIWASEMTKLTAENINCYVEADKFFALLPEAKTLKQGTCLEIILKNGARYELPFIDVTWDTQEMPTSYSQEMVFKLQDLMLCTLQNLVKPELQCIYIDKEGAVSCDFMSACLDSTLKSNTAFLLPPDVQPLIDGRLCKVEITEDKIFMTSSDFNIVMPKPVLGEDKWWENLRELLSDEIQFTKVGNLLEGLRRLEMFGDYIKFSTDKVTCGENEEPFTFKETEGEYEIEKVGKVLQTATQIGESQGNLILTNTTSKFLISPQETI